jgi:hypothetical protein
MPGGKSNIRGTDGNTFSSTNQPANRGRKPKVFTQLSKDWQERGIERATPAVVQEAFEYILGLPLLDVKDLAGKADDEDNNVPMAVRLAAKELLGKRAIEIFKEMLDRAHGKSMQRQELSGQDGAPLFGISKAKQEDIDKLLDLMDGK